MDGRRRPIDEADLAVLRASTRTLRQVAAYTRRDVLVGRDGEVRGLSVAPVDPELFAIARTPAALGRTLLPADAAPGAEPVIVPSERAWRVAFGGVQAIVGAPITINGVETGVAGVMPEHFGFPAKLSGSCFAFARLLAVAGAYGLMSTAIGQRTREIGVRRALGASDATATRMLLAQAVRQLGIGSLVAAPAVAALGFAATRLLPLGPALTERGRPARVGVNCRRRPRGDLAADPKALRVPMRTALLRD